MKRRIGVPAPSASSSTAIGVAPRIETTGSVRSETGTRTSSATGSSAPGFIASTTTSARSARSRFESAWRPPTSPASMRARSASASLNSISSGPVSADAQPRASALAIFPAPISPTITGCAVAARDPASRTRSALVEEALLEQPGPLFRGDLDVPRSEQKHLVGDSLHASIERVGEPARKVDEPLGEVGVGALEVEDHRDRVLELVGDLLSVVEVLGHHQVHTHLVARAAVSDRTQHPRLSPARRGVVGEDVVDLVAAPP